MWNYYSKNGRYEGYNIGFDWKTIKDAYEDIEEKHVIYKEKDQIDILKNHIKELYENYINHGHSIGLSQMRMKKVLSTRALQFKNPAFAHEEEVRLVYWRPDNDETLAIKAQNLHFRQTQGIIIPYVKIKEIRKTIRSIMIGPLIKKDVAENTVEHFLKFKGLSIPIKQSVIPIRY